MATTRRVGELEIGEDFPYQQRSWMVQRIGWIVLVLLLITALLGVFGSGPLSQATASSADGSLSVEYPRFARFKAPTDLRITLGAAVTGAEEAQVWIDRAYLDDMALQQITPQPAQATVAADRIAYVFRVAADQPVTIMFRIAAGADRTFVGAGRCGMRPVA